MPGLRDLDDDEFERLASGQLSQPSFDSLSDDEFEAMAAPATSQGVRVVGRDGTVATLSPEQADLAIAQGARPFEELEAERREAELQAEYGGAQNQAITAGQGGLRGLTLGLSDAAGAALTGGLLAAGDGAPQLTPEARQRIAELNRTRAPEQQIALPEEQSDFGIGYGAAREYQRGLQEANPGTALSSELGGALLGGGAGLVRGGAGAVLAATPAGLASRAAFGAAEATGARLGGGMLGRVGGMAAGGAVEGAIAGAAQQVADAVPEFSTDPIEAAEHILYGAGEGAILGAALGAGASVLTEGAGALIRGAAKTAGGVLPDMSTQGMRDFAYESATKAAIGRTNIAAIREASRYGGTREIGKTLLEDGIVSTGDNVQAILQKATAGEERYGQKIGELVAHLDEAGVQPDTRAIAARIRAEVIDPLIASPSSRARGEALAKHFEPLLMELDNTDGMFRGFQGLWNERRVLDREEKAAFAQLSPTADGIKAVRRSFESSFTDLAEQQGGGGEWRAAYQEAKRRYSHTRFAADQAGKAIESQQSNRWFSPSDYGMAGVGAIAGDPLSGVAVGLANKVARERGRATVAAGMNWLANFADQAQQKSALVAMTANGQQGVARAAQQLVTNAGRAKYAAGGAITSKFTEQDFLGAVAEARELGDPNSETSQELASNAQQLDMINPGMGTAYAIAARARGQLISSKLPKPPSEAIFGPAPVLDPVTDRKLRRTVRALYRPKEALVRIAAGTHSPEDVEAIRDGFPAMYRRFRNETEQQFRQLKKPPNLETRLRIAYATGLRTDPSMEVGELTMMQRVAQMEDQAKQAEQKEEAGNAAEAGGFKPGKMREPDEVFAGPVDSRLDRR